MCINITRGLLHQLAFMAEATMISVCWTADNLEALVKTFKFIELAAGHMLAITNLAICVNLALVIMVSCQCKEVLLVVLYIV